MRSREQGTYMRQRHDRAFALLLGALLAIVLLSAAAAAQERGTFRNLQVLPGDISRAELNAVMLDNLLGLGLPRLQGEGCLYCHVGDMETPREGWDYASDAKPMKLKARVMMAMTRDVNASLSHLPSRLDATYRVTCFTCHAGRSDPRPLSLVIMAAYEAGGVDSAAAHYGMLRRRYFGSDAYDLRVGALADLALRLADRSALDDAVTLAALERDVYPDSAAATRSWLRLVLEQKLNREGVQAALAHLDSSSSGLPAGTWTPGLLDAFGWRVFRQDRKADATAIIRRNLAKFPEEYIPNESMAFILDEAGDRAAARRILEQWLAKHPDHARARRLLVNLGGPPQ